MTSSFLRSLGASARSWRSRFAGAAVIAAVFSIEHHAHAALTSSEKGQIRDFVSTAKTANAYKVRSLIARTDLTREESIEVLTASVTPVAFNDQRGSFLKELVFGGASAPSRPILVLATVKALLARADSVYQRYVGGLDHEPRAAQELVAIYGWLDSVIANAGSPTTSSHDANAGIPAATYEECSKALRDHVDHNARWLKGDGPLPESVGRLRAQAQMALVDMLPDGLTRRVDASDRLGLSGARRAMLTEWGVLFADTGKIAEPTIERVRAMLARVPGARADLGLIYAGAEKGGPLNSRGLVAYVVPGSERYPFADEAAPGNYDGAASAIAHDLAYIAAKRALDNRGELRLQAERDAAAASGDRNRLLGHPRAPSVEHVIGGAVHALLVDGTKSVEIAAARALGGQPETAALLSDALGAIAAYPPDDKDPKSLTLEVGRSNGFVPLKSVRVAPNGTVVGFSLDGHTWSIDRAAPSYEVAGMRRDGAPVMPTQLTSVKGIPRDGTQWTESGYKFVKMRGAPRVALSQPGERGAGPNVKLLGGGVDGFDAITSAPPSQDYTIEGELVVRGAPGGLAFRLTPSKKGGLRGATLVLAPGGATALSVVDDTGETNLAAPISPSPTGPVKFKIIVQGTRVEATVGATTLRGTLPDSMAGGDVAIIGKRNASVEISAFTLSRR